MRRVTKIPSKPKPMKGRNVTPSGMIALQATITPEMDDWLIGQMKVTGLGNRTGVIRMLIRSAMDAE
jgi:hypothetical protein